MMNKTPARLNGLSKDSESNLIPQHSNSYGHHFHFYMYGPIIDANDYISLIRTLDEASNHDVIHLHINGPGGVLDSAICIVNALRRTEATTVAYADAEVSSAYTLIFLSCDLFVVSEFAYMMFHDASLGQYGKQSELTLQTAHSSKHLDVITGSIYRGFLKKKEIKEINKGVDLWLTAVEIEERLKRLEKFRTKEAEANSQVE